MVAAVGLSYAELRNLPLDELFEVHAQVQKIVKARKQATQQSIFRRR